MTVEPTNDMEINSDTVASVPKKTKSSPSKTARNKKEETSSSEPVEKKKSPRARKQVLGAKAQGSLEERLKNEVALVDVSFETEEIAAKAKVTRAKKTTQRKTQVKSEEKPKRSSSLKALETAKDASIAVEAPLETAIKSDIEPAKELALTPPPKKTTRRGRPKKNVLPAALEDSVTVDEKNIPSLAPTSTDSYQPASVTSVQENNQSIEIISENIPLTVNTQDSTSLESEEKKGRKPRRIPKIKAIKEKKDVALEQDITPLVPMQDKEENAAPTAIPHKETVEITVEHTSIELPDIEPMSAEHTEHRAMEQTDENTAKSRRGRRGGRGKRGKKRTLSVSTQEQNLDDTLKEQEELLVETKPLIAVSANKSTRTARMAAAKKAVDSKTRKMFISMVQGEQVEVALVESGIVHEYYLEMLHQVKTKGNIYKGVVNNIDANLQAAFVNYGANKNGFLQIDEIHPEYYQAHHEHVKGKKFPPIQKIIKPGQEVLVQVVKEPTGNKGAFLTTWLSLPGRFLVLTPGQEQIGVSRKVDNDEERSRLRELMTGIDPGAGLGVIVRTASAGTTKTTLKSDLQYLKRVWREIRKRGVNEAAPALLYRESSLAERAIRDYLTDDVTEVWIDCTKGAENVREMVALLFPRKKELVRVHTDSRQTLWERFSVQKQLEQIYAREVVLPSGGRLVFDQTEALMAIDINSGKISGKGNFESMALKTNIEAAEAIARHLKLRDIGGQVVIDFIEMRDKNHIREVEKTLRNAMKNDRARHDVARMSSFGLLEIVRQRTGSSALAITMEPCPHCRGTGQRRNLEWQALQALCEMERKGRGAQGGKYSFETDSTELALYLLNHKRQRIAELEEQLKVHIEVSLP